MTGHLEYAQVERAYLDREVERLTLENAALRARIVLIQDELALIRSWKIKKGRLDYDTRRT